ncbi:MAG TPA: cysteine synthase family protein [Polyangiaceae bacterium]|nr:cysteine synthase family protein [Polyangiaceae bacterium]
MIHDDVLSAIGRTPLVRLRRVVPRPGAEDGGGLAEVLVKLEYFAPGGSVKDRAALWMIEEAERRGALKAGDTVVEASAGNTGVGLAVVCAVRGYRCVIVLPETTSTEKQSVLRALGAEIVHARADVEASDPEGYIGRAEALGRELGAHCPDQFENPANPGAHYASTGPEILADCEGKLDAFVACVGSGGTLAGTARFLRQHLPGIRVVGAMPERSACAGEHGGSLVEGVIDDLGDCSQPDARPDDVVTISDRDAVAMTLRLAREEAILAGGSAGVAVCAAIQVARELGAGKRVVAIAPDTGRNYLSTYFDAAWRAKRGV